MLHTLHRKLVHTVPGLLAIPAKILPFSLQEKVLSQVLNRVFSEGLEDDEFEFLEQKWLQVEITDLGINWFISCKDNKLVIAPKAESVDVSFKGNLNELVLITARKEDPDTLFFQRRLKIEGDTELGLEVKNMLDSFDLDELPKPVTTLLTYLADFIQQGLVEPEFSGAVKANVTT
ncbi:ubiquinone anaerobic biosynthesis accessory factor UbiT [Moritella viscosa]|uniref:Ubiquinone biosynthesis accessory factor UbiT n=1 Tax=Moritella viscosa TaxID=80854 RepID=A0A090KCJ0_9GAMM|nr:SCP2 domain-containing protein [Moritella viscosa]CED61573.1 putative sterol binding protein [Moritella viscosa]SGY89723.1 Sterol binding protein [Moritella viscosa]SGY93540.1 Sterol binding protein [Moritella viscosa]SGY97847.1 Sterol binding protein [Moritella viscosa]SGY98041.1 Sterol binding protein [Moritella viscosa]